jgi:hypothetical protein
MASTDFVYGKGRIALNSGQIDLLTATIGAALVTAAYSPQPNGDQFLSAIPGAAIVAQKDLTATGLSAAGAFFGTIAPFNALVSAAAVTAVVLYVDTGVAGTSALLYYSSTGPGFPFLPQGFTYVVTFDQSSGGYFQ